VGRDRPEGVDGSQAVAGVGRVGLARGEVRLGQAGNGFHAPRPVVGVGPQTVPVSCAGILGGPVEESFSVDGKRGGKGRWRKNDGLKKNCAHPA